MPPDSRWGRTFIRTLVSDVAGLAGHVDALAVHVERPPVVDAAEVRSSLARSTATRPVSGSFPAPARPGRGCRGTHQVLAEQPDPRGRAAGSGISGRQAGRRPYRRAARPIRFPAPRGSDRRCLSPPKARCASCRWDSSWPAARSPGPSASAKAGSSGGGERRHVMSRARIFPRRSSRPFIALRRPPPGLLALGEAARARDEDCPHPGDGPFGGAERFLGAFVIGPIDSVTMKSWLTQSATALNVAVRCTSRRL